MVTTKNMYCIRDGERVSLFVDKDFLHKCIETGVDIIVCEKCGQELTLTPSAIKMVEEVQ